MKCALFLLALPLAAQMNYDHMADRIVKSLALEKGERVIIRYDPGYFHEITAPLKTRISAAGATVSAEFEYLKPPSTDGGRLEKALKSSDVYLWMPLRDDILYVSPGEQQALTNWLAQGGKHREIHFHWTGGSVLADGLGTTHPPAFDRLYQDALNIDYAALSRKAGPRDRRLAQGHFAYPHARGNRSSTRNVGDRPMNKQDGDASGKHVRQGKMKVDREIELPAGVVRVAPLEKHGLRPPEWFPKPELGKVVARNIRFEISSGASPRLHRFRASRRRRSRAQRRRTSRRCDSAKSRSG